LNEAIFGNNENTNKLPDIPARFNIGIEVDVFGNWKLFLVDCDCKSIFIFKNLTEGNIRHFVTLKGEFDGVIKEFYSRLEAVYDSFNA
jgi:hypothetical protein